MSETLQTPQFKTIHPEYKVVGFDGTSRVYSTNPSLSQIPKILRHAIVPHDGNKFLYVDLKAAEVYILVKWAKCYSLIDAYESGKDLYTVIAQTILNKEELADGERDTIKAVVLSILYGSDGSSVARSLHISEEEANGLVDKFLYTYPEIALFQAKAYKYTVDHGYIESFYFRPRILVEDQTDGDSSRKRQCVNSAIQNTCADCLKLCLGHLNKDLPVKFVTTVFDSVLFEIPKDFTFIQAKDFLSDFFSYCKPFSFKYEFALGNSWGEAQDQL